MIGKLFLISLLLSSWFHPAVAEAAMSSTNYYIYADSIDNGGGFVTSTSFDLQGTLGETPTDATTSSSYIVRGGYQSMESASLEMSLSASGASLGELSASQVKSNSITATITSDSANGYTLSIASISGTGITGVADGVVTAGSQEFGIAVSGNDAAFTDDKAPVAGLVLASATGSVLNRQSTLIFKASISTQTTAGSYSQTLTLTASGNL